MTDFKIRRGLSTDLFVNGDNKAGVIEGVVLENGCWYLCTDTADLFLCVQQTNGLTLKRINEKAGFDITIDGTTIDPSVIIALRAEVSDIKESLNDYTTKQYVADAIKNHEALATVEEVKTKLETEVLPVIPTVQETILPTVQKVEAEILPTVQELVEKSATQEWVNTQLNVLENNIGYIATDDRSFAEVIEGTFAKKSEVPSIDGLATETFVHEMIAKAELEDKEADLEAYYTKDQVDAAFATKAELPSVEGLASEDFVIEKITEIEIPSIDGLATEQYVDDAIANIDIPSVDGLASEQFVKDAIEAIPETDLSNYYTQSETDTLVNKAISGISIPDVSDFITIEDVEAKDYLVAKDIAGKANKDHTHSTADILDYKAPDLSIYYTKAEVDLRIPDTSKFIKEIPAEYVTESELAAKGYITDVSNKADKNHNHDDLYEAKGAAAAAAKAIKDELLNGASSAYDTLKELGDLIKDNAGDIKSLESIATGKADKDHTHADYAASEHTHDQYLTEQNLNGYAKQSELFSKDYNDLINKPDLFSGKYEDLTNKPVIPEAYNDTELRNLISGKADSVHIHDNYADKEHTHAAYYYTKSEVDATLEGYAKAEDIPTDYLTETDLDGYAKSTDLSDMATQSWVKDQGFITNVDNKADTNHTHDEYLTSSDLAGYSKFSGSYKDLTDKPEIPSLEGYALKSEIELKANNVLFTADKYVTTAFGGFAIGESVKDLTIAQLLTKLLGLADEAPSVEPDVPSEPGNVTIEDVKQYSIPVMQGAVKNGEVTTENTASAFNYLELTEAEAEKAPQEAEPGTALLYEIKDNSDNVIEAGYQIYTIASGRGTKYRVALAEGLTITKVEMFDDGTKSWVPYELTFTETGDRLTHDGYSYVLYESSSSSNCEILRFIIE